MKLILLGAPGAGKGTQAEVICKHLGIPAISTGNILREALKSGTEMVLGKPSRIKPFLQSSSARRSLMIPMTISSGTSWPASIKAFALRPISVPLFSASLRILPDEKIVTRMSGRRVCEKCGSSYHLLYKKPAVEGVCTNCGGTLVQRKDDHPDTVKDRLRVYHEQTEPLKEYYEKQGKLHIVEGQEEVADTTALTLKALEA